MKAFFAAPAALWDEWSPALTAACPELELRREGEVDLRLGGFGARQTGARHEGDLSPQQTGGVDLRHEGDPDPRKTGGIDPSRKDDICSHGTGDHDLRRSGDLSPRQTGKVNPHRDSDLSPHQIGTPDPRRNDTPNPPPTCDPASFDAVIYAPGFPENGAKMDFTPFTNARIVQSLWAGVERITGNPTLTQPLCRMVDPGLAQGMVEYCTGWALRLHLGMDAQPQDGLWRHDATPPLAQSRQVVVLGMGELGRPVAAALQGLGFRVTGWSASGRAVPGIEVLPGPALPQALARADILITLLPDTPDTRDLLNADRLSLLPAGAMLINPGRGTLIEDAALLAALDRGHLSHAVLDVFRTEPLPPAHPFWAHPRITVTPHVAAATRAETAARVVAANLRRAMAGQPLLYQVNRAKGY